MIPREHGAWALWLVPFFVGSTLTGFRPAHWLLLALFFFGSALHAKAMIRERNNPGWKRASLVYHAPLLAAYVALGTPRWLWVAVLVSFVRAASQPQRSKLPVVVTGFIEIATSIAFYLLFVMAFRPDLVRTCAAVMAVGLAAFLLNVPLGRWRARLPRFSARWFVAIHASIPLIIGLRHLLGIGYGWVPITVFFAVFGQLIGAQLAKRARVPEAAFAVRAMHQLPVAETAQFSGGGAINR
ncbi:MAG: YwiC-like family protein [Alicyclobacillaceae bacterium]|nr:YwiC-like family protein [Alicyclobacillaceae bacterium]